jgi:hypothetical protein
MLFSSRSHSAGNHVVHNQLETIERLGLPRGEAMPRHHQQGLLKRTVQRNRRNSFCRLRYYSMKTTLYLACKDLSPPLKRVVTSSNHPEKRTQRTTSDTYNIFVVKMACGGRGEGVQPVNVADSGPAAHGNAGWHSDLKCRTQVVKPRCSTQ